MTRRRCDGCGGEYEALTARSRWCSERCRGRARRAGRAAPERSHAVTVASTTDVLDATTRELEQMGAVDSPLGQAALVMARAIDDPATSAAGVVACARELRECLDELRRKAPRGADPVDELRKRRERRRGGGDAV